MKDFVHLHVHSDYSMQDGISKVPDLVKKVKQLGMKAMALTDHGYISGAIEFYTAAKEHGIKPIIGVETYVSYFSIHEKTSDNKDSNHLVLLAKNLTGYRNLVKLMSIAATEGFYYQPRIDYTLLRKYSEGLICTTACLKGAFASQLYNSKHKNANVNIGTAYKEIEKLLGIFKPEDLFIEMMFHGLDAQRQVVENGIPLAKKMNIRVIATNDAHYVSKDQRPLRDIMMADRVGTSIYDPNRTLKDAEGEYYIKSPEQMANLWASFPEAITNTVLLSDMIEDYNPGIDTGNKLPKFSKTEEETRDLFGSKVVAGFKEKYPGKTEKSEEWNRLQYEISVIDRLKFKDYFLILHDIVKYAESQDISIGPGRGSAAGSIVSYCLDITTIDPIEHDLLFERFLNPDRSSLPDIDIDVCKADRGKVIDYIVSKYGKNYVALIGTFNRLKGKGILRTVGRALDIPFEDIDRLAKLLPKDAAEYSTSLTQVMDEDDETVPAPLKAEFALFTEQSEKNKEFLQRCLGLENVYKSSGTHAAGVVIGPQPLAEIVPLKLSNNNEMATQLSMEDVEKLGLLKLDLLGLETLTIVSDCLRMIRQDNPDGPLKNRQDIKTYRHLQKAFPNKNDPAVYNSTFAVGSTMCIFQCEGSGLRALLSRMSANKYSDIAAAIALYRPGPLDAGITESFVKRRNKREQETSWIPELEKTFKDTHGLAIYQEQIMIASRVIAGFDMKQADELRKIIGKKHKEDIEAFRVKFVQSAKKTGKVDEKKANLIYDQIEKYGRYAFNKSHSISYADICFYTAWLKHYYPEYMISACLNRFCSSETQRGENTIMNKKQDEVKMGNYVLEAQSLGIKVLPPDISESEYLFKVVKQGKTSYIRFGIGAIKAVSFKAQKLIEWRNSKSKFKNPGHFIYAAIQCGMNRKSIGEIIEAGCTNFDTATSTLLRLVKGFRRPCRCKKSKDASEEKTKNCKVCKGEGLTRSEKSILDDIKDIAESYTEVNDQMIEELGKLFEDERAKPDKECSKIESLGLFILRKEIVKDESKEQQVPSKSSQGTS